MRCLLVFSVILATSYARPGLVFTQPFAPSGAVRQRGVGGAPHPSVEQNAASEALLPRELLKSRDFYDNPAVAEGLAKESWFTNKEMQVVEREAEKIPRKAFTIL